MLMVVIVGAGQRLAPTGTDWERESIQDGATSNWVYGSSYWEVTPRDREEGGGVGWVWWGGGGGLLVSPV